MVSNDATTSPTRPQATVTGDDLRGAPSALSPDAAWMLPSTELVDDVESSFRPAATVTPPRYGGLRYTADWWESRATH
ncbi:hypothetical protein ACPYO6_07925 [Georgenia sp. Z1344]|uniref:hypothetical protein n=1 Tax=Georgenia sp. Z1344 TaxID=3416706 RepID=UPI003CF5E64E